MPGPKYAKGLHSVWRWWHFNDRKAASESTWTLGHFHSDGGCAPFLPPSSRRLYFLAPPHESHGWGSPEAEGRTACRSHTALPEHLLAVAAAILAFVVLVRCVVPRIAAHTNFVPKLRPKTTLLTKDRLKKDR